MARHYIGSDRHSGISESLKLGMSSREESRMQRLDCHVKEYAWGKKGPSSEVARLFSAGHQSFRIGQKTPYAELWMGTHPDGPARVRETAEHLSSLIARSDSNSSLRNNNDSFDLDEVHLPFIMKIMSIKHTLSLQVHPTKAQAAILHERDPKNYPDRNHKPELAYALTRFELLCGFRPSKQIYENMEDFPELTEIMGLENSRQFRLLVKSGAADDSIELKTALRDCFSTMIFAQVESPQLVDELLSSFKKKVRSGIRGCLSADTIRVLEQTWTLFPSDVGCFAPLYLNHMILQPGECCFYAAEELHAYLSGECVECVGCSNNTIRAGLTPKFVDRETLIDVLNYRMTDPEFYMVPPRPLDDCNGVVEYAPDCKDFTLHQIKISEDEETVELPILNCASIMIIVGGSVKAMEINEDRVEKRNGDRGDIFYIPPQTRVRLTKNGDENVLAYRTFSYEVGPDHSSRIVPKQKITPTTVIGAEIFDTAVEMDGFL